MVSRKITFMLNNMTNFSFVCRKICKRKKDEIERNACLT